MPSLESLLNDLANFDAQNDFEAMKTVREQIVAAHPDTDEAVESIYRLGLDFLFRQRDLNAAIESFSTAAKRKHEYWSKASRTSLGLCYYHQGKLQKALFELRRVGFAKEPNPHAIAALAFLEDIFLREGDDDEALRVRKERLIQLQALCAEDDPETLVNQERGYYLYQLGVAYLDQGEDAKAKIAFDRAKSAGEEILGEDLFRAVLAIEQNNSEV